MQDTRFFIVDYIILLDDLDAYATNTHGMNVEGLFDTLLQMESRLLKVITWSEFITSNS